MLLYVYSKCSTCKEALRFLKESGAKIEVKEISETPPTVEELKSMLSYHENNIRKLFNTSGHLYREMGLSDKLQDISIKKAFELLSTHGMLVKRPFLLGKDFGLLGFNQAQWSCKLSVK